MHKILSMMVLLLLGAGVLYGITQNGFNFNLNEQAGSLITNYNTPTPASCSTGSGCSDGSISCCAGYTCFSPLGMYGEPQVEKHCTRNSEIPNQCLVSGTTCKNQSGYTGCDHCRNCPDGYITVSGKNGIYYCR